MTRKILINGRREEELRVAIVENQTLEDFEIETKHSGLLRNNIYRGVVSSIAPSLNAAFVDFGEAKNGFLAFNDVVESVYSKHVKDACRISDILAVGQELIVQVIKDAGGLKGAQVTTNVSIAGRYLVLRPRDAKSGVSRKVDDDARADLTQKIRSLDLPEGYGCIVRTNAMDQSRAILLRDARVLVQLWHKIEAEFGRGKGPQLLYNDQDIVVQAMRDYFDATINEVLIDDKSCFERAKAYVKATFENGEDKLKYYEDKMPLFTRYGIEKQIEQIYARTVCLPSGGFIVIDPTEALTAIDVNSAHSTKRESQDLTAYHTNLEAAVEIARQLRMRDIGGLIVIDFIDMRQGKHQRDVERVMRNAMSRDKARSKVERISANGLLEINRQRISQALSMRTHLECPTCGGRGFIPSAEAIGMTLIREIDARAVNGELGGVVIKLHPDIAQQLQNERRLEFAQLEMEYGIRIEIVGTRDISRGDESIEWLTKRQENELHPERTANQTQDTASIIDVAEVYQTDDSDEAYRPNDFEVFSSEEARKRRAEKRAARREMSEKLVSASESGHVELSAEEVSGAGEAQSLHESVRTQAVKENKESKKVTNAHSQTGLAILGVLLAQMKEHVVEETKSESGRSRRFSFRNRRRTAKAENGIQSDLRMFVMDLLKSVCVTACGCTTDVTRREMLDRLVEASDWLIGSSQGTPETASQAANAVRNQISSRHATARLSILLDASPASQTDDIGKLLLAVRKEAFNDEEKVTENRLRALKRHLSYRIEDIFALTEKPKETSKSDIVKTESEQIRPDQSDKAENESKAPIFDAFVFENAVEDVDIDELREVLKEPPAKTAASEEPAFTGAVLATNALSSGRQPRMRGRRRGAIGEGGEMFISKDAEVITSDVPIAPMTKILENQNTEELENAITQEIPAVKPARRIRRTRVESEESVQPVQTASVPVPAEDKSEKSSDDACVKKTEAARRVRRTRRNHPDAQNEMSSSASVKTDNVFEESPELKGGELVEVLSDMKNEAAEEISAAEPVPAEEVRGRTRRVRKTRRSATAAEDMSASAEASDTSASSSEIAETAKVQVDIQTLPAEGIVASESVPAEEGKVRTRRVRKTRRSATAAEDMSASAEASDTSASSSEIAETAKVQVDIQTLPAEEIVASESVPAEEGKVRTRRVRKTRRSVTAAEDMSASAEASDTSVSSAETGETAKIQVDVQSLPLESSSSERKKERASRRTRSTSGKSNGQKNIPAADDRGEDSSALKSPEAMAETTDTVCEPEPSARPRLDVVELLNASQVEANRSTRRVRKTRPAKHDETNECRASETADEIDSKAVEEFSTAAEDFHAAAQEFNHIMGEIALNAGNAAKADEEKAISAAREFCKSKDEFQVEAAEFKKIVDVLGHDENTFVSSQTSSNKTRTSARRVRRTRRSVDNTSEALNPENQAVQIKTEVEADVQGSCEPVKETESVNEPVERTRTRRTRRSRPADV